MTTLAAIELEDGSILIGSDSMSGNCHRLSESVEQYEASPKWVRWPNGWFIGLAGYASAHQDLQDAAPEVELDESVASVRVAIKKAFSAYGDPEKSSEGLPEYKHSQLLAARAGTGVFTICAFLSAIKIKRGRFIAEGAGRDYAYGAFRAVESTHGGVSIAFHEALATAIELDQASGPPIMMKELLVGEEAQDLHPPPRIADLAPKDHPVLTNGGDLPQRVIKDAHVPMTPQEMETEAGCNRG